MLASPLPTGELTLPPQGNPGSAAVWHPKKLTRVGRIIVVKKSVSQQHIRSTVKINLKGLNF